MKAPKIRIALLVVALITSLGFLGRTPVAKLRVETGGLRTCRDGGTKQAMEDFQKGRLRLRVIQGENERLRYSGSNNGPFEVWIVQFYPSLGFPHRYSTEQQVEFYNRKMRYMHEHPDKFAAVTNTEAQKER